MRKNTTMKQLYLVLLTLCAAALTATSCINKDEVVLSSDCGIISFKVGNISSDFTYTDKNGVKHTERRVIDGSYILFNIDQEHGTIETVDSMPFWADFHRVCPTIVCHGNPYLVNPDGSYWYINSGSDSLDFSRETKIIVASTDGLYRKPYTLKMHKHSQLSDTMIWKPLTDCNLKLDTDDFTPVQFNSRLYIFSAGTDGKTKMTSSADGIAWTEPENLRFAGSPTPAPVVIPSTITTYNNRIYGTDADGKLYSTGNSMEWSLVDTGDRQLKRTITSDAYYMYALNATGDTILATMDTKAWIPAGTADLDHLPSTFISSASSSSATNPKQQICSLFGLEPDGKTCAAWFKVSSQLDEINQKWEYINPVEWNKYPMPELTNPTITGANGIYFLTGDDYKSVWKSMDYGISWREQTSVYSMPETLDSTNGVARFVLLDDLTLFIIQNGGQVWTGELKL